jgi:chemotaxis protein CheX
MKKSKNVFSSYASFLVCIFGQDRQEIEKMGKLFHGAIPTVVTGKNHKLIPMVKGPKIAIPFKTDAWSFTIEVCLEG